MAIKARLAAVGAPAVIAAAGSIAYFYEGEHLEVYADPVGVLTACVGHTSPDLRLGQYFTSEQCAELFLADIEHAYKTVRRCTPTAPPESVPALTSFAFNIGSGAYCRSTLARKMNDGDVVGACQEMYRWVWAGGRILPGLERRRADEAALCLAGALRD